MQQRILRIVITLLVLVNLVPVIWHLSQPDRPVGVQFRIPMDSGTLYQPVAYISGAVMHSGVYNFHPGDRLSDLVSMAGGFQEDANIDHVNSDLNLAQVLEDELHVFIPRMSVAEPVVSVPSTDLIMVNIATVDQLKELPGIGEASAKKIIEGRPYVQANDLLDVPGIGESKLAEIIPLISFDL